MIHESILVVAAGLQWENGPGSKVLVDRETAAVCKQAAELASECSDATLYVTAGLSPKFGVVMNTVMTECLVMLGVPKERIETSHIASVFKTRGEMAAFPKNGALPDWTQGDTHLVFLVVRDFHLKRSRFLLEAQYDELDLVDTVIIEWSVKSQEARQNNIREPIAFIKDWLYVQWQRFQHRLPK